MVAGLNCCIEATYFTRPFAPFHNRAAMTAGSLGRQPASAQGTRAFVVINREAVTAIFDTVATSWLYQPLIPKSSG